MEGWLEKQGHTFKTWKRRWVVLEPSEDNENNFTLAYYVDESRSVKKGEFIIALDSAVTNLVDGYASGRNNLFALQAEGSSKKNFLLMSAPTEEIKNTWIIEIERAVETLRERAELQWQT
mmetsp:Transcript_6303/g.9514  ORF Transcript_6303/g.9514 Transcript_6303/m.9514 type:complete len:120 (+) Transcript_6303:63-422(+)